jgi:hypothetical protein
MGSRVLSGIAIVCVAFAAGCGGGGSSTSATGASGASGVSGATPLTEDEFVSQADAVCKDVNDKIAALPKPTTTADLATVTPQVITISNDGIAQLEQITPPTAVQSEYSHYIAALKSQTALAGQLVTAAKANDTAQINQVAAKLKAGSPDSTAKDLNLTECAKDVSPQG